MAKPGEEILREALTLANQVARKSCQAHLAEDVAQDVVVKFAQMDLDDLREWRAWVSRTTRNAAIDAYRKTARFDYSDPDMPIPPPALRVAGPSAESMWPLMVRELTRTLTARERDLRLASLEGYAHAELAQMFGYASANTVGVTLQRVRTKVRQDFADRDALLRLLSPQRLY